MGRERIPGQGLGVREHQGRSPLREEERDLGGELIGNARWLGWLAGNGFTGDTPETLRDKVRAKDEGLRNR